MGVTSESLWAYSKEYPKFLFHDVVAPKLSDKQG
jgi:hypothetical protein